MTTTLSSPAAIVTTLVVGQGPAAASTVAAQAAAAAALVSQSAAEAAAVSASDDQALTAADRVQTGSDRIATGEDRGAASIASQAATASANLAAANVQASLLDIKTQTEAARDAALAGLGAADQSANLVQLLAGISYAADMVGQLYGEIYSVDVDGKTLTAVLDRMLSHIQLALDIAGQAARQVGGGAVQLAAGTVAEPSLWPEGDRNTGVMFPAADTVAVVTGGIERLRVDGNGRLGIGTNAPSGLLDVNDDRLRVRGAKTPATAGAAGNAGDVCWDGSYVYVCTATNTWKRSALASW